MCNQRLVRALVTIKRPPLGDIILNLLEVKVCSQKG